MGDRIDREYMLEQLKEQRAENRLELNSTRQKALELFLVEECRMSKIAMQDCLSNICDTVKQPGADMTAVIEDALAGSITSKPFRKNAVLRILAVVTEAINETKPAPESKAKAPQATTTAKPTGPS